MYGLELLEEMEVEAAAEYCCLLHDIRSKVWTMKDGKRIRVEKMSDTHLSNTIRLLERRASNHDEVASMWLPVMRNEYYRRKRIDPFLESLTVEDYTN